jgi:hypothetical protein
VLRRPRRGATPAQGGEAHRPGSPSPSSAPARPRLPSCYRRRIEWKTSAAKREPAPPVDGQRRVRARAVAWASTPIRCHATARELASRSTSPAGATVNRYRARRLGRLKRQAAAAARRSTDDDPARATRARPCRSQPLASSHAGSPLSRCSSSASAGRRPTRMRSSAARPARVRASGKLHRYRTRAYRARRGGGTWRHGGLPARRSRSGAFCGRWRPVVAGDAARGPDRGRPDDPVGQAELLAAIPPGGVNELAGNGCPTSGQSGRAGRERRHTPAIIGAIYRVFDRKGHAVALPSKVFPGTTGRGSTSLRRRHGWCRMSRSARGTGGYFPYHRSLRRREGESTARTTNYILVPKAGRRRRSTTLREGRAHDSALGPDRLEKTHRPRDRTRSREPGLTPTALAPLTAKPVARSWLTSRHSARCASSAVAVGRVHETSLNHLVTGARRTRVRSWDGSTPHRASHRARRSQRTPETIVMGDSNPGNHAVSRVATSSTSTSTRSTSPSGPRRQRIGSPRATSASCPSS